MKERKCSGYGCDPEKRQSCPHYAAPVTVCENFTPAYDTSGRDAVVDMAIKQFGLKEEDRDKLQILFDAYATQYTIATGYGCCCV